MGLSLFSKDSYPTNNQKEPLKLPNPNPKNYKILKHHQKGNNLLILIEYPDCTNYEGKKILVYENCTLDQLLSQKLIDPHFSENKNFRSPIARFEPTQKGWIHAINFLFDLDF